MVKEELVNAYIYTGYRKIGKCLLLENQIIQNKKSQVMHTSIQYYLLSEFFWKKLSVSNLQEFRHQATLNFVYFMTW